jgi:hypothetical protein
MGVSVGVRVERGIEFINERDGLPVAAHHGASSSAVPDARDQLVVFGLHANQFTAALCDRFILAMP